jgi:hypothetical protein
LIEVGIMKGFKPTGRGPVYGEPKFTSQHGFTGSTGKVQHVKGFTRGAPRVRLAKGGTVGNAAVMRADPVTEFDREYGGKTPLRSGFAKGGAPKNFIQGAIKHPGALRAALHAKQGQPIPAKKLEKATHSNNPTMRKRAVLAETMRHMHKADGGKVETPPPKKPDPSALGSGAAAKAGQAMQDRKSKLDAAIAAAGGARGGRVGFGRFNSKPMIKC